MPGNETQAAIRTALARCFADDLVVTEWSVRKGATDVFRDALSYAPRLDIAVGPFNTSFANRERDAHAIHRVQHPLLDRLRQIAYEQNEGMFFENRNPRCLIAIEIENTTSSKHILGAITNASMLGLLGVIVGPEAHIAKVRRIHAYTCRLKQVGKAHNDLFGNVACFEQGEFLALVASARRPARRRMSRYA